MRRLDRYSNFSVSVITPIYGSGEDIKRNLLELAKSLENQSVQPEEWLIVGDNTTKWLDKGLLPSFARILECSDKRQATKKNLAIDNSSGKFVFVIDADQEPGPRVIEQCLEKVNKGFKAVTIPEVFQKSKSYLQECYYSLRTVYAQNVDGIPRIFRREDLLNNRFDPDFHYAEDPELWNRLRRITGEPALIEDYLLHKEKFSLLYSLKKVRMATIAQRRIEFANRADVSKRVGIGIVLGEVPLKLLPGVLVILLLRTVARRFP